VAIWPSWQTAPLHASCAVIGIAYGSRIRWLHPTSLIVSLLALTTAVLAFHDAVAGSDFW